MPVTTVRPDAEKQMCARIYLCIDAFIYIYMYILLGSQIGFRAWKRCPPQYYSISF